MLARQGIRWGSNPFGGPIVASRGGAPVRARTVLAFQYTPSSSSFFRFCLNSTSEPATIAGAVKLMAEAHSGTRLNQVGGFRDCFTRLDPILQDEMIRRAE